MLVQPVSQVPPFPVELEYPTEVAGESMTTYLDWMASCWSITVLGGPAISVPCGFTDDGLPVGLQIVGEPGDDAGVSCGSRSRSSRRPRRGRATADGPGTRVTRWP